MPGRSTLIAAGYASNTLDVWVQLGKLAKQTRQYVHIYGYIGLILPWIASHDVFALVQQVLNNEDDGVVQDFVSRQVDQVSALATTGSVLASISLSGLSKNYIDSVHWTAQAFMLASLMSALFCVIYALRLQRVLGSCFTADMTRAWLRAPPAKVWCRNKNRPSIATVLVLDTPRTLVGMSIVSFITGFSLYILFVFVDNLDTVGGPEASQSTMIFYFVAVWFCAAMYLKADYFSYVTSHDDTLANIKKMSAALRDLVSGRDMEEWDEESLEMELGPPPGRTAPANQPTPQLRKDHSLGSGPSTLSLHEALTSAIALRERATQADIMLIRALANLRDDIRTS